MKTSLSCIKSLTAEKTQCLKNPGEKSGFCNGTSVASELCKKRGKFPLSNQNFTNFREFPRV